MPSVRGGIHLCHNRRGTDLALDHSVRLRTHLEGLNLHARARKSRYPRVEIPERDEGAADVDGAQAVDPLSARTSFGDV